MRNVPRFHAFDPQYYHHGLLLVQQAYLSFLLHALSHAQEDLSALNSKDEDMTVDGDTVNKIGLETVETCLMQPRFGEKELIGKETKIPTPGIVLCY